MRTLSLPTGGEMPVLGLGTWRMGEDASRRAAEIAAVREAIVLGYRLIDTAEMYGEGGAETVVGQAVAEALRAGDVRREALFIVSKVYPHNASRRGTREACERSLKRLGLDAIDLYLLHWRGNHPLRDTVDAMQSLVADGRIAHWGVSNFDTDDMEELEPLAGSGPVCAANQVYLSLGERGPEFSLLPWQHERGMPLMAYSPIDQGALAGDKALGELAVRLGVTAAQLALAAVIARPGVAAIPKAVRAAHLKENLAAAELKLDAATLEELDRLHPPPRRKAPLAMI
ncbi:MULTISPECIES: aldo/keto reductase [Variovorax]|jgi:diketogulonate reductase-like aldo/keto reductase|uniref:aldo/keto reductase n=1 Tax=Variovorax TaxID=34072 RepID=UPI00086C2FFB|nr:MULTISPECIES: aldo/keto reductase [Variovorax]MBN8751716.1 aldo/keto reductase [Variovorax sp.]ODU18746.1 MAG: aldo/keto reductase [Variovorax sp. SCN 67-85]ODV16287.1 MAG: aldo/keto reductase [Variovorax sp. SCN 67-20]OJZ06140.1 MAG: aldo/keto reductase [Variovorax sp. 67-131]UKI10555.1 aldo/keto reductase [Variovorax paradoxus]|eukprot:gene30358-40341_t